MLVLWFIIQTYRLKDSFADSREREWSVYDLPQHMLSRKQNCNLASTSAVQTFNLGPAIQRLATQNQKFARVTLTIFAGVAFKSRIFLINLFSSQKIIFLRICSFLLNPTDTKKSFLINKI